MANELAKMSSELPAYLQGAKKEAILGNLDRSDYIIPRVKLMQAISPEITTHENAKIGEFWHTIASLSMGKEMLAVPVVIRKSYILWAPRADDRGILARAMDGVHWDQPGAEFTVKPKNSPVSVTYKLGKTVQENGMHDWGSEIPSDPRSKPAASLTYTMMWVLPQYPEFSPIVIINTRSGVKPAQTLISKIDLRPVDHYAQQYMIKTVQQTAPEGTFWNYVYESAGYADEETYKFAKRAYEKFGKVDFRASDESEDKEAGGVGGGTVDPEIPF